jgi:hypothetical protein
LPIQSLREKIYADVKLTVHVIGGQFHHGATESSPLQANSTGKMAHSSTAHSQLVRAAGTKKLGRKALRLSRCKAKSPKEQVNCR